MFWNDEVTCTHLTSAESNMLKIKSRGLGRSLVSEELVAQADLFGPPALYREADSDAHRSNESVTRMDDFTSWPQVITPERGQIKDRYFSYQLKELQTFYQNEDRTLRKTEVQEIVNFQKGNYIIKTWVLFPAPRLGSWLLLLNSEGTYIYM